MNTSLRHRILVIDDNPSIHEDIRKILGAKSPETQALESLESELFETDSKHGPSMEVDVDSALQGAEGLSRIEEGLDRRHPYSLAFVDMRMPPGWDGIETIQRVWEKDPRLQVVLCTAYSDYTWEDIVSQLKYSENLVILKKPFDNIELLQLAHALTRKWDIGNFANSLPPSAQGESPVEPQAEVLLLAEAFKQLPYPLRLRRKRDGATLYSNQETTAVMKPPTDPRSLSPGQTSTRSVDFRWNGEDYVMEFLTTAPANPRVAAQ